MSTGRKVFRCAVDETALSTNISEIKKWTTNGAIDLVVPLYSKYPNVEETLIASFQRACRSNHCSLIST